MLSCHVCALHTIALQLFEPVFVANKCEHSRSEIYLLRKHRRILTGAPINIFRCEKVLGVLYKEKV